MKAYKTLVSALLVGATCAFPSLALAQTPEPAAPVAAPGGAPAFMPVPAIVAAFRADPGKLLAANPAGGSRLSGAVRALVLADASVVDDLVALAAKANSPQAQAIGVGVGIASKALGLTNRPAAQTVARKIALAANGDLFSGYTAGGGDVQTFATGAGAQGGGATGGGGGGAGGGAAGGGGGGGVGGALGALSSASPSGRPVNEVSSTSLVNTVVSPSFAGSSVSCSATVSPRSRC